MDVVVLDISDLFSENFSERNFLILEILTQKEEMYKNYIMPLGKFSTIFTKWCCLDGALCQSN